MSPIPAAIDGACRAVAAVIASLYELYPSYGFAIAGVTALATALSWPLTAKAASSARRVAALRPELIELQKRHRGDPLAYHAAVRELYRAQGVSPIAAVVPALAQLPLFLVLFRVVNGLTRRGAHGFAPSYLSPRSRLYRHLTGATAMRFAGLDLASPGSAALAAGGPALVAFVALIAVAVLGAYVQHRVAASRTPQDAPGPQALLAILVPASVAVWGLVAPAALTVYAATSAWLRVGQALATR